LDSLIYFFDLDHLEFYSVNEWAFCRGSAIVVSELHGRKTIRNNVCNEQDHDNIIPPSLRGIGSRTCSYNGVIFAKNLHIFLYTFNNH
jgi:hypothetical protein